MKKASYIFLLVLFLFAAARPEAQAQRKISPQAKGTIIGAGAGALGGAIINKRNRAVGGVVGGVVGAGAGYAVGKHIDNKQKERARIAAANRAAAERAAAARATAARKASATSGATAAAATPAVMALTASSAQPAAGTVLADGYLVNTAYGERDTPYPTSEYRRKSW